MNDTGLLISVPYQGDSDGDGVAENYFVEAQILGTHIGARGVPEWSQVINGIQISDLSSDRSVLHQIYSSFEDDKWEIGVDELKVTFEGNFAGLNTVDYLRNGGVLTEQNTTSTSHQLLTINGNTVITASKLTRFKQMVQQLLVTPVFDFSGLSEGFEGVRDTNLIESAIQIYY